MSSEAGERVSGWMNERSRVRERSKHCWACKWVSSAREWVSSACEWASGRANGLVLYTLVLFSLWIFSSSFEKFHLAILAIHLLDITAEMDQCNALWCRSTKNQDGNNGPHARLFARLLAPLTHLLAPHRLLSSFVCSLAHSLTTELMGMRMMGCLKMTWFCPTMQWWPRSM